MTQSWSFADSGGTSKPWSSTPEQRFEEAAEKHRWSEDFKAAATGNYSEAEHANLKDAGKAAFFLVAGLKWNNGNHNGKARETLNWLARQYPTNEKGNQRVWTMQKHSDFIARLFSEETDARRTKKDPLPPRFRRQLDHQKDVRLDAVNRAFWDLWAVHGYATVQEVHAEINQDITLERTRQLLDSFVEDGGLEKIDHPDPDDRRGNPQAYVPEGEDGNEDKKLVTDGGTSSWDFAGSLESDSDEAETAEESGGDGSDWDHRDSEWSFVDPDEYEETETVEEHPDSQFINDVDIHIPQGSDEAVITSSVKEATDALLYHDAVEFQQATTYQGVDEYGNPKHLKHETRAGAVASKKVFSLTCTVAVEDVGKVAQTISKALSCRTK